MVTLAFFPHLVKGIVEFRLSVRLCKCAAAAWWGLLPMLRVTVMMFRDMVESVMLLNDEDCG